ncbi:MAG: hypothetical protein JRN15_14465 [Nitrososphaerota archaeon]|nr:hypothetical protein [Nitrososphaerota archaeon]
MSQQSAEAFALSLDRALERFGTSVRVIVYYELEKSFGISRVEIPKKPELFAATIEKLFGAGAATVRLFILKELESSYKIEGLRAKDLVTAMRTAYHKQLESMI